MTAEFDEFGEKQIKEHFDVVLLRYIPKLSKKIHREELAGQMNSLDERWNFVSKQMKLSLLLGQLESAYHHHPTAGVPAGSVRAVQRTYLPKKIKITIQLFQNALSTLKYQIR